METLEAFFSENPLYNCTTVECWNEHIFNPLLVVLKNYLALPWQYHVLICTSLSLVFALCFLKWLGCFDKITFTKKKVGGFKLLYVLHKGSYRKANLACTEMAEKVKSLFGSSKHGSWFGIYYDSPETTDEKDCRSMVGYIVEKNDEELINHFDLGAFNSVTHLTDLPAIESLTAVFPYKTCPLSYIVGAMKVYPAMKKELGSWEESVASCLEIYSDKEIEFCALLKDNEHTMPDFAHDGYYVNGKSEVIPGKEYTHATPRRSTRLRNRIAKSSS